MAPEREKKVKSKASSKSTKGRSKGPSVPLEEENGEKELGVLSDSRREAMVALAQVLLGRRALLAMDGENGVAALRDALRAGLEG